MTDAAASPAAADRPPAARHRGGAGSPPVTATALAAHLGVTRQYVSRLADDGTIERLPDGRFDQDRCRLRYLAWLRDPARRSARSGAASELDKAKARLVWLRIGEREGSLMATAEAIAVVDEIGGMLRTELSQLPARIGGRDVTERHRIEGICSDLLRRISDAATTRARGFATKTAPESDDGADDDD